MKIRLLVFIDWFEPGYKAGGPVRSLQNMIEHTYDSIDFFVVTSDRDHQSMVAYENIEFDKWIQRDKYSVYYISQEKLSVATILSIFRSVKNAVVYLNGIYARYYAILPLILAKILGRSVCLSSRGMLSAQAFGVKSKRKILYVALMRFLGFYTNVEFHTSSDIETLDIKKRIGNQVKIHQIDNFPRRLSDNCTPIRKEKNTIRLLSIARISPEKNLAFALEVLREIDTNFTVQFDIYGTISDKNYWKTCQLICEEFHENVSVAYKGVLDSEKIPEILIGYHALFLPTKGENFGHSIFETFMSGRPVLISDQTPWRNLADQKLGFDCDLSNESVFVECLNKLIEMDQEEFDEYCDSAFYFASNYFDLRKMKELYLNMFRVSEIQSLSNIR